MLKDLHVDEKAYNEGPPPPSGFYNTPGTHIAFARAVWSEFELCAIRQHILSSGKYIITILC